MRLVLFIWAACVAVCVARIPNNYERLSGHGVYRFSRDRKTWNDAKSACEADGANLAIINSPSESAALKTLFRKYPGSGITAHVGFHDQGEEGRYTTVKGGSLSTTGYNVWKYTPNGSPSNQQNDCGGMIICGRLTDMQCDEPAPFICEIDEDIQPVIDVDAVR